LFYNINTGPDMNMPRPRVICSNMVDMISFQTKVVVGQDQVSDSQHFIFS
jgi:hypothetical protein